MIIAWLTATSVHAVSPQLIINLHQQMELSWWAAVDRAAGSRWRKLYAPFVGVIPPDLYSVAVFLPHYEPPPCSSSIISPHRLLHRWQPWQLRQLHLDTQREEVEALKWLLLFQELINQMKMKECQHSVGIMTITLFVTWLPFLNWCDTYICRYLWCNTHHYISSTN